MTKNEYIYWKATRDPDPLHWGYEKCAAADKLVKDTALANLESKLVRACYPSHIIGYVMLMATYQYGCVETDEFLTAMRCYEEWMN